MSFGLGIGGGLEQVNVDGVRTGGVDPTIESYVELVVQPFCTFGFFAMGEANLDLPSSTTGQNSGAFGYASMHIGAMFEPSSACKKERGTAFGLREKAVEGLLAPALAPLAPVSPAAASQAPPPQASAPAPPPSTEDTAERLRKLKALLDAKVISPDEYKTRRDLILKEGGL